MAMAGNVSNAELLSSRLAEVLRRIDAMRSLAYDLGDFVDHDDMDSLTEIVGVGASGNQLHDELESIAEIVQELHDAFLVMQPSVTQTPDPPTDWDRSLPNENTD